jgi:hypothetical protein
VTVTEVEAVTVLVVTPRLAPDAPAGTDTLAGMGNARLVLERLTDAPPDGAGPLSVTTRVADNPPVRLEGATVRDESTAGTRVTEAVLLVPL